MHPRITIGIPVYRGAALVGDVLQSIVAQTCGDFRVILSVDGGDHASATACRPFLADRRFALTLQESQLGWAGNVNWLARQVDTEFFVYIGQDDRFAPTFCRATLDCADSNPQVGIVYSDVAWIGGKHGVMQQPEKTGSPVARMLAQLGDCLWLPFRGLRRTALQRRIAELMVDDADSALEDVIWVTRALQVTDVKRIAEPLGCKRFHPGMVTVGKGRWPRAHARAVWLDAWARMLAAALPAAGSGDEARALLGVALRRVAVAAPDMDWFYDIARLTPAQRRDLVADYVGHFARSFPELAGRLADTQAACLAWAHGEIFGAASNDSAAAGARRFDLDHRIAGAGWHAQEMDPRGGSFRWSGPDASADLHLPIAFERDLRIRLHVPPWYGAAPKLAGVALAADARPLAVAVEPGPDGSWRLVATAKAPPRGDPRPLTLTLTVARLQRPSDVSDSADTRLLGLPVGWIEVEPVDTT